MAKSVLVIDDDEKTYQLIADVCDGTDYETLYTYDGEQGIILARDEQPRVIILDILLPMMQGWEVASILKASPITTHIPIIAITGATNLENRQRALDAGCRVVLEKPFDTAHILNLLDQYSAEDA